MKKDDFKVKILNKREEEIKQIVIDTVKELLGANNELLSTEINNKLLLIYIAMYDDNDFYEIEILNEFAKVDNCTYPKFIIRRKNI